MEEGKRSSRRVFINLVDSYASKNIAKFLFDCGVEVSEYDSEDPDDAPDLNAGDVGGFQVVGTVSEQSEEETPFVVETYFQLDRDELLSKLLSCDVVVYNISQHADQVEEGSWAVSALRHEMVNFSEPKMFVLISTVMTWAAFKSPDPEDPDVLTDEGFKSRKAHPNFRQHIDLEKKVYKVGQLDQKKFSTYVVASGLQYGMGEQIFHHFFKTSWLGEEEEISIFGDGLNFVPTIHIGDLARVVQSVIEQQPEPQYLVAVDSGVYTMTEIVKAVATELGPGKVCTRPFEESFIIEDLSVTEIDSLLVNLRMSAVHLESLFSVDWLCKDGLLENLGLVLKEYLLERDLKPIRMCVLGPPAVGKSTACKTLCEYYKLPHIKLADMQIAPQEGEPESEKASSAEETDENEARLKALKAKLLSNLCKNHGFVLDGFPETYEQAKEFFSGDEDDDDDDDVAGKIRPEFVLCLEASDNFLMDRVINLPESVVRKHNYGHDHFLRRLADYRKNMESEPVTHYFLEAEITTLHLEVAGSGEPDRVLLLQKVTETVGEPKNYSNIREEEEEKKKAEEQLWREAREKEEEKRRLKREEEEAEEEKNRKSRWEEWCRQLDEARLQEEAELEAQALTATKYLGEHVVPTLTKALVELCKAKPENPVIYLADCLIQANPTNF
ncbi:unnamed protein product [Ophioblennius macclurei]